MPLTEVPQIGQQFRDTLTLTQETCIMVKNQPYPNNTCYFLTSFDFDPTGFRDSLVMSAIEDIPQSIDRQLALIYLSQHLIKNSQNLEEKALGVLNKTSARLFSKTPTRL